MSLLNWPADRGDGIVAERLKMRHSAFFVER